jgi:putative ABC transport system permease protein
VSALRFALALAGREGRAARRRGLLIVAAVATGVAALVAINSFGFNLRDSLRQEAKALLGADLFLSSPAPFPEKAEVVVAELRGATRPRAQLARVVRFSAMARAGKGGTRLVQVVAVDPGYPFYGTIETAPAGQWTRLAETGGALADPGLLVALDAALGDEIWLGEARFTLRATVENVPGDVGVRTAFGPRVFIPRGRVEQTRLLTRGSRARHEAYLELPPGVDAQALAARFRAPLAAERLVVRTVSDDQRRLDQTLSQMANYLGLVALAALLLGGMAVASAVHVFIRRRLDSIAVLRCLGASTGTLLVAYLIQAATVGLLGSLVGAGAGALVQLALPRLMRDLLPVDVAWSVSWRAVLGGVGIGVWVAVVFSLLPLLAVRRVSPLAVLRREYEPPPVPRRDPARALTLSALALSVALLAVIEAGRVGAGLAFATGIGTALLALALAAALLIRGLRRFFPTWLPYLYRQGLANTFRPANQTLLVVLALGFGAFLLGTLVVVQHNLLRELRIDRGEARPNVVFFDVQEDQRESAESLIRDRAPLLGPAVPIVPMRIESLKGRPAAELLAAAEEADRPGRWALRREYRSSHRDAPRPTERVVAGEWWRPGEWLGTGTGETVPIAMDSDLARELEVTVGDEIVWDVQGLSVSTRVACLREVDWARFEPNFFVVFPEGPLEGAPRSFVLLSRVEDAAERARLQRAVVDAHPNVSSLDLAQVQRGVERILDRAADAVRFMALFSLAAGALVLAGAVAASRYQRVREGALLRTLGATRRQLLRILFSEYAVLGALAAIAALILATLGGWALVRFAFESRTFAFPGPTLLLLAFALATLTVTIGLAGSTEVWRRPPLEVLRAE